MDQLLKFGPVQALRQFWDSLTGPQRFMAVVFLSASIAALSVVSVVATKPRMSVLFAGLQADDAGAVVSKLQEKKIPYQIDGDAIKIPERNIAEMRMELARQGLPENSTVGFELFDKNTFGMTEFTQRLNYQRALQGELTRSIDELDGVVDSRVHLAIPQPSVFADKDKEPSASVVVKLRTGANLSTEQVGGIVHLVASAVEGMKPERVTVVDTEGNELSEGSDASGLSARASSAQLDLKGVYERQIEKDIQSMLERVLGPDKAVVRVSAKVNFDRRETDSEIYQPADTTNNTGVLSSASNSRETYAGNSQGARNALTITAGTQRGGANSGGYQRLEDTNKYEVSKTTEHVVKSPGQIERLSVAVMVDDKVDMAQVESIRKAVTLAAGIDERRGDQITVESVKFDNTAAKNEEKEMNSAASREMYLSIGKTVGAVLLLLGFLFFLRGMLRQVKVSVTEPVVVQDITPSRINMVSGGGYGPLPQSIEPESADNTAIDAGGERGPGVKVSQVPPEEVAQIVRKWISDN